jgi:hypothetical protein
MYCYSYITEAIGATEKQMVMKMQLSNKKALKEIKAAAAAAGLTFSRMKSVGSINGSPAYKFYPRGGGSAVISNCTISSAYTLVCAGDLDKFKNE